MPHWLLWSAIGIIVLFVLDATLGRWLSSRFALVYRHTFEVGGSPASRRLLVYLPGILFDGDESVTEVKPALLKQVASGLFISYGFWRFIPRTVIEKTARQIGHRQDSNFNHIVLVGASFGGRVAADVAVELYTRYSWNPSSIRIVMVDTPCENNSFQQPGLNMSLILKRVYAGPLVSVLVAPIIKRILVPPYDVDIEDGINPDHVKRTAVNRMARFRLSSSCDQQRYLADNSIQWTMGLTDIDLVYLLCTRNNITVVQPAAMRKVELYSHGKSSRFSVMEVPSPHCGFAQLPKTWEVAFEAALAPEHTRNGQHN